MLAGNRSRLTPVLLGVLFSAFCLLLCLFICLGVSTSSVSKVFSYDVGLRTFGVWEPQAGERFDFSVWYPSRTESARTVQEGWVVEAGKRGRIVPGFFPVVLISHDTASDRFANNDIAFALASQGMIVITPTHTVDHYYSGDFLYSAEMLRNRPRQLLHALDTVLGSRDFAPHVDESRIGVLGVGFGAITALQLAGAAPDFSRLSGYCDGASAPDAFCAPWTRERLARLPEAMARFKAKQGADVFRPSLALYAPELIRPVLPREPEQEEPQSVEQDPQPAASWWSRLFGRSPDAPEEENTAAAEHAYPAAPVAVEMPNPEKSPAGVLENALTAQPEFKDLPLYDVKRSGPPSPILPQDEARFPTKKIDEIQINKAGWGVPGASLAGGTAKLVFRRLPELRRIRAITLVAPAGGMLFDEQSLSGLNMPVALIEAGQDGLYPPERHAQPYFAHLPTQPFVLSLAEADHFSLFAACSRETLMSLGEACGRLAGDARKKLTEQRDHFLTEFFLSSLGGPLPPVGHSGYIAVTDDP